jgi:putative pyruvate formate lyase activating enzyme
MVYVVSVFGGGRKQMNVPVYLRKPGEFLLARLEAIQKRTSPCMLCPRHCKVKRIQGETGFCKTGLDPVIASFGPHHGEEEPISGTNGSGTIFFSGCTMQCTFCQNYEISRGFSGYQISVEDLAEIFIRLQSLGCHNINLVTPTHQLPSIIRALIRAIDKGLHIPLVYNTGGYEDPETMHLLDGIIDIFMPDFKFSGEKTGHTLAGTPEYPEYAKAALLEMHTQVGDLQLEHGIATRGLLVRYLILPGLTGECREIFRFIAEDVSKNTWINIMDQYYPAGNIQEESPDDYPSLCRRVNHEEVMLACQIASGYGLKRGFKQVRKTAYS